MRRKGGKRRDLGINGLWAQARARRFPTTLHPRSRLTLERRKCQRLIANLDMHRPGAVVAAVAARLDRPFGIGTHTQAWKHYAVRPRPAMRIPNERSRSIVSTIRLTRTICTLRPGSMDRFSGERAERLAALCARRGESHGSARGCRRGRATCDDEMNAFARSR